MNCLNCNVEMMNHFIHTRASDISYDLCEQCGSLWLDKGELDRAAYQVGGSIEHGSKDRIVNHKEKYRKCPRCNEVILEKVEFLVYSNITLDKCPNCDGFWLDGGELDLVNKDLQESMRVSSPGFSDLINNVHVPFWYKRVRRKSSETDYNVDVPPIKNAVFKNKNEYICPVCNITMNTYRIFNIQMEGCPQCKGVFFDKDELRRLKDKVKSDSWQNLRWIDDEIETLENINLHASKRKCPKCTEQFLVTTNFSNSSTLIDFCPQCHGKWLDQGEFNEITEYLKSELLKLSPGKMKKKIYEEIKEIWTGPENVWSEIVDAKASISALISLTIYEHPLLTKLIVGFGYKALEVGKSIGRPVGL